MLATVGVVKRLAIVVAAVGLQIVAGLAVNRGATSAALLIGVVIAAVIVVRSPVGLAALTFPGVLFLRRLSAGGLDLSYADAILVGTALIGLRYAPWSSPVFRRLLGGVGVYLGLIAVTLLFNPTGRGILEWLHRLVLVVGSVAVGAALAQEGRIRLALRLYLVGSLVVAIGALAFIASHGFVPAYPFGIHKNAAGFFICVALIMILVASRELQLHRSAQWACQAILLGGLLATQARASAATFLLVLLVSAARRGRKALFVPVIGAVALGGMIWVTTQQMTQESADTAKFNSLETRVTAYQQTIQVWRLDPWFGKGLRFFRDPAVLHRVFVTEPHNLFISALGETGIVGAFALSVLILWTCHVFFRRRDALGLCALYVTVAHVVDSMAGIYWVAGTGTLPWLVAGLATVVPTRVDPAPDPSLQRAAAPSWVSSTAG